MKHRDQYPDSRPITYGEDNEHPQIDTGEIIRELRKNHFEGMDDFLEEFEDEDRT